MVNVQASFPIILLESDIRGIEPVFCSCIPWEWDRQAAMPGIGSKAVVRDSIEKLLQFGSNVPGAAFRDAKIVHYQ